MQVINIQGDTVTTVTNHNIPKKVERDLKPTPVMAPVINIQGDTVTTVMTKQSITPKKVVRDMKKPNPIMAPIINIQGDTVTTVMTKQNIAPKKVARDLQKSSPVMAPLIRIQGDTVTTVMTNQIIPKEPEEIVLTPTAVLAPDFKDVESNKANNDDTTFPTNHNISGRDSSEDEVADINVREASMFDINDTGTIDFNEVQQVMKKLDQNYTEEDIIVEAINTVDFNGDNVIDFN